jgi:hypothetical protein
MKNNNKIKELIKKLELQITAEILNKNRRLGGVNPTWQHLLVMGRPKYAPAVWQDTTAVHASVLYSPVFEVALRWFFNKKHIRINGLRLTSKKDEKYQLLDDSGKPYISIDKNFIVDTYTYMHYEDCFNCTADVAVRPELKYKHVLFGSYCFKSVKSLKNFVKEVIEEINKEN